MEEAKKIKGYTKLGDKLLREKKARILQKVDDYIFVGSKSYTESMLIENKISTIIRFTTYEYKKIREDIITYHVFDLPDNMYGSIREYLDIVLQIMFNSVKNHSNVLVQCEAGCSRSPSFVIAYFMKKYKIEYDDAFNKLKKIRKCILPKPHFIIQLKALLST